ncbi:hypothetical protein QTP70_033659 [Hemibagrus guttatus]|uniref:PH domain-containing protein n=1 Tax=Hemibagrus guttatus TaxID=175788 RepID=A0AAE0RFE7_9TELE|nr:hypothetical protein QTP70_033659 [Hemibagrus guttatus]
MTKLYEDSLWKKHWFVLTDQSLRYYRDSIAEEAADLDGEIDLSTCYDVTEFPVQRNYGFQIHSKEGVFTLSAMTSGIRRNWIRAHTEECEAHHHAGRHTHLRRKKIPLKLSVLKTSSVPDEHANTKTASPTPSISRPSQVWGQSSCDVIIDSASDHRKPRPRDRRQEGRSKTFDWAEFRNERVEALDTSSSPSPSSVSSSASSPSSSVSERKLLHREQEAATENKKGHVGVASAVPSVTKNPDVQMEIEERWHRVETTPLREEKQVPITGSSASFTVGDKVSSELTSLLDTEPQRELVRLQEQNTLLQEQLHDAEQTAREGYVLQCTSEPEQPSSDSTSSSTSHRVPWQRLSKLNQELKTELEAQRRKHDLANQQVNSLRRSYSEAQDMIGHHETEIEALQAKLVSAMAEILASEQAVARMRSELKLEQSRCREREEEWSSNEKTLRAQLRDSEERLRDVEASLLEKTQTLRQLERQQAFQRDQHKEVQRLQEKLNEVTGCLIATEEAQALREERERKEHCSLEEKHERERQGFSRRLAESEEKRLKAEEQLQEARDQVETLLRGGGGDRVESDVREEILRQQQVLGEQADVIEDLRESVRRLEDERDHLTCRCQELVNQIAEADREVGKLQAQLKTEETDYYSLESSYERVSKEFARITCVLREKEEEVRQTKETYEKLMRQKDQDLNEALVKMAALGSSLEETEQRLKAKDELLSQVGPREVEQELQEKLVVAEDRISELEEHLNALRLGYANLRLERCGSQEDVLDALEKQAEHDISFSTISSLTLARSSSETEVSFAKRQRIRFSNIQCQKYHQSQRIERVPPDNTYLDFTQGEQQDLVPEASQNLTDDTIQDLSQDISLVSDNTFQYCSDTEKFLSIIHALESKLQATEEKLRVITSKKQNEEEQPGNKGLMEVCCDDTSAEPDQDEPDGKSHSCLDGTVQDSVNNEDYKKALAFVESCRVRVREILNSQAEEGTVQAQVLTLAEIEKDLVSASLHIRQVAARYEDSVTCQSDAQALMDKSAVKVLARMLAFEGTVLEKMAFSLQDPKSELMQSLSEINKESQQVKMNHQDCLSVIYTDILTRKLKLQSILMNELKIELHQAHTFSEQSDNLQTPGKSVFDQNTIHNACINAELAYSLQNLKHSYQDKFEELQRDLVKVKEILQQRDIVVSEAAMPLITENVTQDVGDKINAGTETTLSEINPPELAPYAQQIEREEAHTLAQEIIERHLAGIMQSCVTESVASLDTSQEILITELKRQAKVLYHMSEQLEKACEEDNSSVLGGLAGQLQAVLGPRDTSILMCNSLSMHEALIQVQVAYVACRLRAEHERELSLCQETSHNMATLVQEHAQHVAAIHQRFQSSLEEERIHYFKTINSIQEENETLRDEAAKQLKEMGRQQEQIVQMEEAFQREMQEMKRMHAEELGRTQQERATSELALIERAENTQQKLENLLQEVEGAELRHKEHICKLENDLRGKVQELENVHQEEIQKLHDRYTQTIRTLGERLETIADDTHHPSATEAHGERHLEEEKGHEQEASRDSMSLLRSRVQELELQMMNMRDELENKPPDGDMASLREKYQKDFDSLKETCERGFAAMEETHQKVIEDLQRQHQREINKLLEERERLLEEETNATIAGIFNHNLITRYWNKNHRSIEAMKNAHREELEKTQRAQLSGVSTDIEQLRVQYEEELQSIHRELEVLSEQYSQKCLENTHLAQALEAERQALQQCQRENQQLHTHNQELNNRLTVEISRMRSCYSGEKAPSPLTQGKDLYELEVLLRIKDSEIQYLKQEINSLKDELQSALREVTKDPTTTSKELQASPASVKVSVHDSTIRKRLGKNGLHGRVPRRKPLLSKKNIKARLSFARKHLDDPQDFWENTLWTDETKMELFGRSVSHYVWRKSNTAFQKKNITPTVKYGGGSVMVWGCSAASGPGRLAVINGTMNSAVYQKILKENVRPSVCDLELKRTWVLQQDNDPKHTSKSTSEWLKENKMKTLEWLSQSPDLNPIEMLWHDLKKVVHARKPSNVAELQQFCKDEWAKIPPQRCNRLIASYGKRLIAVPLSHRMAGSIVFSGSFDPHDLAQDKMYAADKYKDIYTELSIVRAKADCDISKLREKLLAATEALGERDTPTHTPGYDIMKSKSNPDFLKKERSAVSRQVRGVRSKFWGNSDVNSSSHNSDQASELCLCLALMMICVFSTVPSECEGVLLVPSEMEALLKERDEMEKRLLADKDRLVLELEEVKEKMEKEKERLLELQRRESEVREAQMREEMEALLKERDEMRRRFQADKYSLMLQLEEEKRNMEKKTEWFYKRQKIAEDSWKKHSEGLEQIILEEEKVLETMTAEVVNLIETVEELKQKARNMDPETREGLKEVDKRLKNFGPRWFQKLRKRTNIKRRQDLEKEIERLELQLRDSKAREARSTEVINVLVKERVKMKRHLELGLIINIFQTSSYASQEKQELMECNEREVQSTKVINALVKEREEMKKELQEEKRRMVLELEKERKNMEKEKNQERFELLKRERQATEEFLVVNELRRRFQAEKERMEQKTLAMATMQEMTEELEAGEKELETADKKLKRFPIPSFQKLRKKNKKKTKESQQMKKEQERATLDLALSDLPPLFPTGQ